MINYSFISKQKKSRSSLYLWLYLISFASYWHNLVINWFWVQRSKITGEGACLWEKKQNKLEHWKLYFRKPWTPQREGTTFCPVNCSLCSGIHASGLPDEDTVVKSYIWNKNEIIFRFWKNKVVCLYILFTYF